jgi:hypothetical protein
MTRRTKNEERPVIVAKCAHPACECIISEDGEHGKYCSEHCKEAAGEIELRCDCQHGECRREEAALAELA